MPSLAKSFTEGDEIFMIKYKGNILSTDYTKSYTIVSISDECQEESGNENSISQDTLHLTTDTCKYYISTH